MPDRHPLQEIKTFPSLVKYLREELDWPIESDDFDDLMFEYEPEDLGLDSKTAAQIDSIKQLRPLTTNQPWGIFFVKFRPLRLPVVALRKILANLVIKNRATAKGAGRAAWKLHDLLFISAFGDDDDRQITLAHFADTADGRDLPTLKVLGWDELDTQLNLRAVDHTLHDKLRWPADDSDVDAWREQWSSAFVLRHRHVITTAEQLAERLAELAKAIRAQVAQVLAVESARGPVRKLYAAFQQALIHDLTEADFADMYAQTVTYGLFSAAVSRTTEFGTELVAENLVDMVPVTNPFLREMLAMFLIVGGRKGKIDFDELGIRNVTELLTSKDTDLIAVVRNFGDRRKGEDPVIHFYEDFLKQYDKKRKIERGVFYTPQPVVSYIVRSVHELLQTEFGLTDGLADVTTWGELIARRPELKLPTVPVWDEANRQNVERPIDGATSFVQILDPATGTATFLVEVIDVIHKTMVAKWTAQGLNKEKQRAAWNEYVPKHLLPRLHGYELMMAPYAIAHMKIGLKLSETGYGFQSAERARIYLTNALEPASPDVRQQKIAELSLAVAHEAKAVNDVKRNLRFTVVIGNPPYSNFGQLNKIPFILNLLEDYKRGLEEKKLNLDDDFIKFVRFSQHLLGKSGVGVLGFITNNVYADGVTHRRMRESLMETFEAIRLLDLHGSSKRQERAPGGAKEENVFDITVGVGIGLFTRGVAINGPRSVVHSELWGERPAKYAALLNASVARTQWTTLSATTPHFFFVPKDFHQLAEYQAGIPVQDVFSLFSSGIQTKRDNVAIAESKEILLATLKDFARLAASELRIRYSLPGDGRDWKIEWASDHAKEILKSPESVAPILYRPFDLRWTVMDSKSKGFVAYPRFEVMSQMVRKNLGLIVTRQLSLPTFQHVFATRRLIDGNTISLQTREYNYLLPLYLRGNHTNQRSLSFESDGKTNLGTTFLKTLASRLKLRLGSNGLPAGLTPEDIFHYAYAVFHSPGYRSRYAEFLKIDFPRLPLTGNLELFRALAQLGGELTALHLLESPTLDKPITEFTGARNLEVEKISWSRNTVWIDKAQTRGFRGVLEKVWNFHIGGYQVCEKWLKDRKGRTLSGDDVAHYHKIVVALNDTIRLMQEIDVVIERHGGWPGAFAAGSPPADAVPAKPEQVELPFA